jgi:hypothetical protein
MKVKDKQERYGMYRDRSFADLEAFLAEVKSLVAV